MLKFDGWLSVNEWNLFENFNTLYDVKKESHKNRGKLYAGGNQMCFRDHKIFISLEFRKTKFKILELIIA